MSARTWKWAVLFTFAFVSFGTGYCQEKVIQTTIEEILARPETYINENVRVQGTVERYIKGTTSTTSYYLLKGDFGGVIRVNTTGAPPQINSRYAARGVVNIDSASNEVFLTEGGGPSGVRAWLIAIVAVAAVAIVVLVVIILLQKRRRVSVASGPSEPRSRGATDTGSTPAMKSAERTDLTTVRIVLPPRTMKFVPGELLITSGEDAGKSFRIAGYPTPEGSLVTIGKEAVSGDRMFSHIRIDARYLTVSRKQAELLYREGRLFVRNRSTTNYTTVDGRELAPGETAELLNGSLIRMGELELKYKQ